MVWSSHVLCACCCVQLLGEKETLALEVQQLTQDCDMQQQKNAVIQAQMRELLAERDQVTFPNCWKWLVETAGTRNRSGRLVKTGLRSPGPKPLVDDPVPPGLLSPRKRGMAKVIRWASVVIL